MRLRGKDFEGKWSLGVWAERHIIAAINATPSFRAVQYGKSEVARKGKDRTDTATVGKRPDLLVFDLETYSQLVRDHGPDVLASLVDRPDSEIAPIVRASLLGIECEASIWEGKKMPHYGRPWDRGNGRSKPVRELKSWTAPTLIVKEEDMGPLKAWEQAYRKPIHVVHLFLDLAFILPFSRFVEFVDNGTAVTSVQDFGDSTKPIHKVFYGLATEFGQFAEVGSVEAFRYQTTGGKFKSDLYFSGGKLDISLAVVEAWSSLLSEFKKQS